MNGERLLMNSNEKSKTYFDKFTFSLENKSVDELMMDSIVKLICHDRIFILSNFYIEHYG